jgi:hypothetical protein
MRKVMTIIDVASAAKGFPTADHMNHTMANTCYFHGESATIIALIPPTTNTGRNILISRIKWGTVVKFMHKRRGT